jgi:hypothetical protein
MPHGDGVRRREEKSVTHDRAPRQWIPCGGATGLRMVLLGLGMTALLALAVVLYRSRGSGDRPEPGVTYLWQVLDDQGAGSRIARRFTVATEVQHREFQDASRLIRDTKPGLGDLLIAHLAIRRDLYEQAERSVRTFLRGHPDHRLARATLRYLYARVGSKEAAARP